MKKFAILALAATLAAPASAAGVTISGYVDLGYIAAEGSRGGNGGQASGSANGNYTNQDGFVVNEVNLDLSSQLTNDISAFVSVDAIPDQNFASALAIDYAYLDIANPGPFDLNLRVGRIPSVMGIAQRNSESPQTKFVSLPLTSIYNVGSYDGAAIYGSFSPINYALAVTNGDLLNQAELDASAFGNNLRPGNNNGSANGASFNTDNALAISGRLGVVPIEGLEIGISGSHTNYAKLIGAPGFGTNRANDLDRSMVGVDASYAWGAWNFKGEWVRVEEDDLNALGQNLNNDGTAWYIEALYDMNEKLSLGARYNESSVDQAPRVGNTDLHDVSTIQIAGTYRISDNVLFKAEYAINDEDVLNGNRNNELSNDVLAFSLVGSF